MGRFSDKNLVFLDETGFNRHTRRSYGYSPVNSKAYVTVQSNRGANTSVLVAIDKNGVIAYEYKSGAFNTATFLHFLENKLAPYFYQHPNKVLVMDNVAFHKSASIKEFFQSKRIVQKFITPYFPELNQIEEFFSMLKSRYYHLQGYSKLYSLLFKVIFSIIQSYILIYSKLYSY